MAKNRKIRYISWIHSTNGVVWGWRYTSEAMYVCHRFPEIYVHPNERISLADCMWYAKSQQDARRILARWRAARYWLNKVQSKKKGVNDES